MTLAEGSTPKCVHWALSTVCCSHWTKVYWLGNSAELVDCPPWMQVTLSSVSASIYHKAYTVFQFTFIEVKLVITGWDMTGKMIYCLQLKSGSGVYHHFAWNWCQAGLIIKLLIIDLQTLCKNWAFIHSNHVFTIDATLQHVPTWVQLNQLHSVALLWVRFVHVLAGQEHWKLLLPTAIVNTILRPSLHWCRMKHSEHSLEID